MEAEAAISTVTLVNANNDTHQLTVSIALATYNGERFLPEQLDSILRQSVLPDELVASDDGSTDNTLMILKSFADAAPFKVIILSNKERVGYRKNFLRAAMTCKCDIIFFCDQDDVWDFRKISSMRAAFLDPETVMAYHQAQLIDETGIPFDKLIPAVVQNPWQPLQGMLMAFRRSVLMRPDLIPFTIDCYRPEENLAHDGWIELLAFSLGKTVVVAETLIGYRQHQNNVYGANQPRVNFATRMRTRIKDRSNAFALLAETCRANKRVFGELSHDEDLTSAWKQKARFAEEMFGDLGLLYDSRSEVYKSPSLVTRFLSFFKLAKLGAYSRAGYWTFGRRGAVRDIVLGICLSPLVTKLGCETAPGDANCRRLI